MESNQHTAEEQEAIRAMQDLAKTLRPVIGNVNTVMGVLRSKLTEQQKEQMDIDGVNKQIDDVMKSLSEQENKLFNLRF